jgi:urease accessory protein
MKARQGFAAFAAALVLCSPAFAHHEAPLSAADGFASGFTHPWLGLDHLLAMIAVGLLAAQMSGRALWVLPSSFLGMMIIGGTLGIAGSHPPIVETAIALSVVALGVALAWGKKYPLVVAAACVGAFGLVHGQAHGAEMPALATPLLYAGGFILATALLHGVGLACGLSFLGYKRWETFLRLTGGAITCAGVMLLVRV